jgi:calcineurin-like phosphoesterase family protein
MKTYFTADDHFDHERILQITDRDLAYSSVETHNDGMLEGINSTVGRDDRLFIIGDFAWRAEEAWYRKIVCRNVHLIFGNHDKAKLGKIFKSAEQTAIVKIQGHKVFVSHYPNAYWPSSHRGSMHLYGHVHAEREATLDAAFPGRRSMDCGVDNAKLLLGAYRPFSENEVVQILMSRPGHDLIEWYDQQRAARRAARDTVPNWLNGDSVVSRKTAEGFAGKLQDISDAPPEHVCGAAGYDGMRDPRCPGCEARDKPLSAEEVARKLHQQFLRNGNYGR